MKESLEDLKEGTEQSNRIINNYNLSSENRNITNNHSNMNDDDISFSEIDNPIINRLLEFGYNYKLSKKLITYLNPPNIEQAIEYLSEENGIIQHHFIQDIKDNNICTICGKIRELHLRRNLFEINNLDDINSNNNNSINDSYVSKSITIKEEIILEGKTENKICEICDEEYIKSNQTKLEKCSHSFCKNCWLNYITINIIDKKLIKIKCMESKCEEILPENFIYTIIKSNNNLISQYKNNKLREEILSNPRKKFCPFPDCNSYARKNKNEKNVKCENGHIFCFYCLKNHKEDEKCEKELDEKMEQFAKKKFIKKCPNCGCWTEKYEGCNHITCIKCGYQWCWLCNEKYKEDHYNTGKCKGFQFFKPKNEKEIQLAFEGKIRPREDEIFFRINPDFENPRRLDFPHFDYFEHIPERRRRFNFIQKFFMFILYLFLGFIIVIICESGKYLSKANLTGKYKSFFIAIYFILIILFGFSIFLFKF